MKRSLALLAAALLACTPSVAGAQNNGSNGMTDRKFGGGNSITLTPVGSGGLPGVAVLTPSHNGVSVLVRAQNLMPKTTAYIARGYCGDGGQARAYPLRPLANGVSETKLPNVSLDQLHDAPHSLVIARPGQRGGILECGDIRKPTLFSK